MRVRWRSGLWLSCEPPGQVNKQRGGEVDKKMKRKQAMIKRSWENCIAGHFIWYWNDVSHE